MRTSITPNAVTFGWLVLLLGAAFCFACGSYELRLLGGLLILVGYALDCVDGELARLRGLTSKIGSTLEQMVHWVTNCAIVFGVAFGLYRTSADPKYLLLGLVALVGDTTFHFMYVSLHVAASPGGQLGLFGLLTRLQFLLMPIQTNLFLVGAPFNRLDLSLWVWAVWSNLGWIVGFLLFFRVEVREEEARKMLRGLIEDALRQHHMEAEPVNSSRE